jgi:hypothetical protein
MLGDPTVPTSRKRKALQEIKALNDKYGSESNKASSPVPAKLTTEDLLKKYGG